MGEPLVSVIVPVYETEKYVRRAVESICNQTYDNLEVILVNDGSPDNSEEICLELAREDNRVKYYYQENAGVASARNLGLSKADGEYVLFCDSDDEWKENLLELTVKEMQESGYDMVRFSFESRASELIMSDDLPEKVYSQKELFLEYFSNSIIYRNISSSCFGVFRLQIIKENRLQFDERLKHGEDGKFVVQYINHCEEIKYINQNLYVYYPFFEDRITATSRNNKELYNEYELCCILFEEFYKQWNSRLSKEEKQKAYGAFYDRVIGRLVRFAAYSTQQTRIKDKKSLKDFLYRSYVIDAGNYYQRIRSTDSKAIPFLMKKRCVNLLWLVLRGKRERYYQMYGKKQYAESIWKMERLNETGLCK